MLSETKELSKLEYQEEKKLIIIDLVLTGLVVPPQSYFSTG